MIEPAPFENRLKDSTSPYLLQHADNPVAWYPWGEEALSLARRLDRPILLSIGYSACHWCHVMAHESFEDPETAALMNRLFVNIKVDREERPDLDKVYQSAHQLLSGRPGGWPLTVFLAPDDLTPFFAGTYFPSRPRHGLPSFRELLFGVERAYREQGDAIRKQSLSLRQALASLNPERSAEVGVLDAVPLEIARQQLERSFDAVHGGFGSAPKFPHPSNLELLLHHWQATSSAGTPDSQALAMVSHTLERMANGGLRDQLGGGFFRYSVDDRWEIPHFEKMLYDNGLLLALYADAWLATRIPLFRETVETTADWVIREMQSPEGGYYSSLDADSEGEEGRFYVWTIEEVRNLLSDPELRAVTAAYGLDGPANFEQKWHLKRIPAAGGAVVDTGALETGRQKLLEARASRVPPGRDDKILTAWNALMIRGMARAGRLLGRQDYLHSAQRACDFLRRRLWRDGRLLATCKGERAHLNAYLDDYAYLAEALLELLQTRWSRSHLDFAVLLADALLERFLDRAHGGFYFTADGHEALIQRPKSLGDEAIPAGNGIAARTLIRLGHLIGNPAYLEAAEGTLMLAWPVLQQIPYAHGSLLTALEEYLEPPETLVIRAPESALETWRTRAAGQYAPRRLTLAIPNEATDLPGPLAERASRDGGVAYLCTGTHCHPPIEDPETLGRMLAPGNR